MTKAVLVTDVLPQSSGDLDKYLAGRGWMKARPPVSASQSFKVLYRQNCASCGSSSKNVNSNKFCAGNQSTASLFPFPLNSGSMDWRCHSHSVKSR